eukprot:g1621.t1
MNSLSIYGVTLEQRQKQIQRYLEMRRQKRALQARQEAERRHLRREEKNVMDEETHDDEKTPRVDVIRDGQEKQSDDEKSVNHKALCSLQDLPYWIDKFDNLPKRRGWIALLEFFQISLENFPSLFQSSQIFEDTSSLAKTGDDLNNKSVLNFMIALALSDLKQNQKFGHNAKSSLSSSVSHWVPKFFLTISSLDTNHIIQSILVCLEDKLVGCESVMSQSNNYSKSIANTVRAGDVLEKPCNEAMLPTVEEYYNFHADHDKLRYTGDLLCLLRLLVTCNIRSGTPDTQGGVNKNCAQLLESFWKFFIKLTKVIHQGKKAVHLLGFNLVVKTFFQTIVELSLTNFNAVSSTLQSTCQNEDLQMVLDLSHSIRNGGSPFGFDTLYNNQSRTDFIFELRTSLVKLVTRLYCLTTKMRNLLHGIVEQQIPNKKEKDGGVIETKEKSSDLRQAAHDPVDRFYFHLYALSFVVYNSSTKPAQESCNNETIFLSLLESAANTNFSANQTNPGISINDCITVLTNMFTVALPRPRKPQPMQYTKELALVSQLTSLLIQNRGGLVTSSNARLNHAFVRLLRSIAMMGTAHSFLKNLYGELAFGTVRDQKYLKQLKRVDDQRASKEKSKFAKVEEKRNDGESDHELFIPNSRLLKTILIEALTSTRTQAVSVSLASSLDLSVGREESGKEEGEKEEKEIQPRMDHNSLEKWCKRFQTFSSDTSGSLLLDLHLGQRLYDTGKAFEQKQKSLRVSRKEAKKRSIELQSLSEVGMKLIECFPNANRSSIGGSLNTNLGTKENGSTSSLASMSSDLDKVSSSQSSSQFSQNPRSMSSLQSLLAMPFGAFLSSRLGLLERRRSSQIFHLDPTNCSSAIEVSDSGLTITNHKYETWGTVRADTLVPIEGISSWEVKIDTSPKGHIFLGVATSEANLNSYLGSDRYGWGYIGNRGAWHNKKKAKSYGKDFRTGDLIKVIVDMDNGNLSFELNGEHMGIALSGFKGMEVFPAFALYQNKDQCTITNIQLANCGGSSGVAAASNTGSTSKVSNGKGSQSQNAHKKGGESSNTKQASSGDTNAGDENNDGENNVSDYFSVSSSVYPPYLDPKLGELSSNSLQTLLNTLNPMSAFTLALSSDNSNASNDTKVATANSTVAGGNDSTTIVTTTTNLVSSSSALMSSLSLEKARLQKLVLARRKSKNEKSTTAKVANEDSNEDLDSTVQSDDGASIAYELKQLPVSVSAIYSHALLLKEMGNGPYRDVLDNENISSTTDNNLPQRNNNLKTGTVPNDKWYGESLLSYGANVTNDQMLQLLKITQPLSPVYLFPSSLSMEEIRNVVGIQSLVKFGEPKLSVAEHDDRAVSGGEGGTVKGLDLSFCGICDKGETSGANTETKQTWTAPPGCSCTFRQVGREFMAQMVFECYTCGMKKGDCICLVCALTCHKGHILSIGRKSARAFCDCGPSGTCQAMHKPPAHVSTSLFANKVYLESDDNVVTIKDGQGENVVTIFKNREDIPKITNIDSQTSNRQSPEQKETKKHQGVLLNICRIVRSRMFLDSSALRALRNTMNQLKEIDEKNSWQQMSDLEFALCHDDIVTNRNVGRSAKEDDSENNDYDCNRDATLTERQQHLQRTWQWGGMSAEDDRSLKNLDLRYQKYKQRIRERAALQKLQEEMKKQQEEASSNTGNTKGGIKKPGSGKTMALASVAFESAANVSTLKDGKDIQKFALSRKDTESRKRLVTIAEKVTGLWRFLYLLENSLLAVFPQITSTLMKNADVIALLLAGMQAREFCNDVHREELKETLKLRTSLLQTYYHDATTRNNSDKTTTTTTLTRKNECIGLGYVLMAGGSLKMTWNDGANYRRFKSITADSTKFNEPMMNTGQSQENGGRRGLTAHDGTKSLGETNVNSLAGLHSKIATTLWGASSKYLFNGPNSDGKTEDESESNGKQQSRNRHTTFRSFASAMPCPLPRVTKVGNEDPVGVLIWTFEDHFSTSSRALLGHQSNNGKTTSVTGSGTISYTSLCDLVDGGFIDILLNRIGRFQSELPVNVLNASKRLDIIGISSNRRLRTKLEAIIKERQDAEEALRRQNNPDSQEGEDSKDNESGKAKKALWVPGYGFGHDDHTQEDERNAQIQQEKRDKTVFALDALSAFIKYLGLKMKKDTKDGLLSTDESDRFWSKFGTVLRDSSLPNVILATLFGNTVYSLLENSSMMLAIFKLVQAIVQLPLTGKTTSSSKTSSSTTSSLTLMKTSLSGQQQNKKVIYRGPSNILEILSEHIPDRKYSIIELAEEIHDLVEEMDELGDEDGGNGTGELDGLLSSGGQGASGSISSGVAASGNDRLDDSGESSGSNTSDEEETNNVNDTKVRRSTSRSKAKSSNNDGNQVAIATTTDGSGEDDTKEGEEEGEEEEEEEEKDSLLTQRLLSHLGLTKKDDDGFSSSILSTDEFQSSIVDLPEGCLSPERRLALIVRTVLYLARRKLKKWDTLKKEVFAKEEAARQKLAQTQEAKARAQQVNSSSSSTSSSTTDGNSSITTVATLGELYTKDMKRTLFKMRDMRDPKDKAKKKYLHHYDTQISGDIASKVAKSRQKRLTRELRSLKKNLPLHIGSSVLLRVDSTRPFIMRVLIFAPENTPYDSGGFLFDLYCPPEYPNVSPKCILLTTGKASVRFNPNLYQNGKVCLSLLGTWRGGASGNENWTKKSSLLQLFVSIQSAILGSEFPYFNEPGVESQWGTEEGEKMKRIHHNGGYERLRIATIQWAMTDLLKNPPVGFEQAIRTHFSIKSYHIRSVVDKWLAEAKVSPTTGHYAALNKVATKLFEELDKIPYGLYVPTKEIEKKQDENKEKTKEKTKEKANAEKKGKTKGEIANKVEETTIKNVSESTFDEATPKKKEEAEESSGIHFSETSTADISVTEEHLKEIEKETTHVENKKEGGIQQEQEEEEGEKEEKKANKKQISTDKKDDCTGQKTSGNDKAHSSGSTVGAASSTKEVDVSSTSGNSSSLGVKGGIKETFVVNTAAFQEVMNIVPHYPKKLIEKALELTAVGGTQDSQKAIVWLLDHGEEYLNKHLTEMYS